jgi:hypothetical protein
MHDREFLAATARRCKLASEQPWSRRLAVQFTVGLRLKGKVDHVNVEAEDALVAALKVKAEKPEAVVTYVRKRNRRGDTRHPAHKLTRGAS